MASVAELTLARDAIVVPIHLRVGAVAQEEFGLLAEVICEQCVRPSQVYLGALEVLLPTSMLRGRGSVSSRVGDRPPVLA